MRMRVACCLFTQDLERIPLMGEAMLAFSPQIALSWEAVFVEIGRCRNLYSEADFCQRVQQLAARLGIRLRLAIADDLPSSLAFARYQQREREALPISAVRDYLNPFVADPSLDPMLGVLHKLGVRTLGAFLALEPREVGARFGKMGTLIYQKIQRAEDLPWPRFQPVELLSEQYLFEPGEGVLALEPLIFVAKQLFDRLLARLRGRGQQLLRLEVELELERWSTQPVAKRILHFAFPLPQNQVSSLLTILQERLQGEFQHEPLPSPVRLVRFIVRETAPYTSAQKDLFMNREAEAEAWASLLARLIQKLGPSNIFFAEPEARHLPEASWRRTLQPQVREIELCVPPRPLRILPEPQLLRREGDSLRGANREWRILRLDGPEYISGEWWFQGFAREYYRVETDLREELWIYHSDNKIYLHGIFD